MASLTGKSNLTIRRIIPAIPLDAMQVYNSNISDKNITGDIFLGYGKRFNCVWLAVEALGSLTSLNSKDVLDISGANTQQRLNIKTTYAWGGAINLGYYINTHSKLYLKLGVESRRFTTFFDGTNIDDPNIVNVNQKKNSIAFVPGLGLETDLNERLSLRGEYRVALHSAKINEASGTAPNVTTIKVKPSLHYFTLGLAFKI
jgi:opacity protein-like surface antigen